MLRLSAALLLLLLDVSGAEAKPSPLARRVQQVREMVSGQPRNLKGVFTAHFLSRHPPAELTRTFRECFRKGGRIVSVRQVRAKGRFYGEYRFYSRSTVLPLKIGVRPTPPHQIHSLRLGVITPRLRSLDEVVRALGSLPGKVSFALWRVGEKRGARPRPLKELNPDLPLAVGSAFKLYLLGSLVQEINAGRLRWARVIRLRDAWRSWPSGLLHTWPDNAPVTLQTLATQMIAISDNTATDHLLFLLGRRKVEAQLGRMGHSRPALNRPLLSTREMYLLKSMGKAKERIGRYSALSEAGRRRYLDRVIATLPREAFHGIDPSTPSAIDRVEWFASAADLCRALDWLRVNTTRSPARRARQLLTINKGLGWQEGRWRYVGYKGGSEPGVQNVSWLLRDRRGRWLVLSAAWNNPRVPLDTGRLYELIQSLIFLLETEEPSPLQLGQDHR
jgi:hypothetical protein